MSFSPIRERDASGALMRAGFEWYERRDTAFIPFLAGALIFVPGVLYGLFLVFIDKPLGYPVLIGSALIMWLCWRGMRRGSSLSRALTFDTDGAINTPKGIPGFPNLRRWEMKHSDTVSIEANMNLSNSSVVLFKRGGERELLAQKLSVDEARQVAVQLTMALTEIRMAIGGKFKIGDVEVVID